MVSNTFEIGQKLEHCDLSWSLESRLTVKRREKKYGTIVIVDNARNARESECETWISK